jgi:glycosyltransferase involved in cell wall biosynthesis
VTHRLPVQRVNKKLGRRYNNDVFTTSCTGNIRVKFFCLVYVIHLVLSMQFNSEKTSLKVSIITAVYNRCDTIGRAIESISGQSYPLIEHVIVDGASTDGTLEVLSSNCATKATIYSEPDKGIYDALNKGLSKISGDVVGFVHSDDMLANNGVIAAVVEIFDREDVDVVYGDAAFFNKQDLAINVRTYVSGEYSVNRLAWGWMPAHPAMFIRKSVYEKFGGFETDYKIAADYEFLCRIAKDNLLKSYYLPEILIRMQFGGASTSGLRSTITLNKEVLRACRSNHIKTNLFMILSKYPRKLAQRFMKQSRLN